MANGVLAGLFGGASPHPVDPQMQQGLLGDAGRAAGIALLSQAMNPNIGQGLAAALAAGQQTYQGGAREAYQVGRQEEQDRAYREYQQSRAEAARALAESRRAEAQAGAEEAEAQAERVEQALADLRERDPDAAQRLDTAIKLFGIDGLPASMASLLEPPEPEPEMTPYQREQVRLAKERLKLARSRAEGGAASRPGETREEYIRERTPKLVSQEDISPSDAVDVAGREWDAMQLAGQPTETIQTDFGSIRVSQGDQPAQRQGAPERPEPQKSAKEIVDAALDSLRREDRETVEKMRAEGTPDEQILALLAQAGY